MFADTTGHCWPASVIYWFNSLLIAAYQNTGTFFQLSVTVGMADHSSANTARATDSSHASEIERPSSTSALGLTTRTLSSETSATAMARFSLDLKDLEAASALGALAWFPKPNGPVQRL